MAIVVVIFALVMAKPEPEPQFGGRFERNDRFGVPGFQPGGFGGPVGSRGSTFGNGGRNQGGFGRFSRGGA